MPNEYVDAANRSLGVLDLDRLDTGRRPAEEDVEGDVRPRKRPERITEVGEERTKRAHDSGEVGPRGTLQAYAHEAR